jgi:membrane-bound serine protease (ClpP class)
MEILLNPNIAYLVIVIGFLIAILALFTPGTGVLEVVALALLALAGWQISQLDFNWYALIIMLVGVFPFLLALRKTGKWYHFVIALLALTLGSTFLFVETGWKPTVNPFLAALVNLLVVGFFWLVLRKGWDALLAAPRNQLVDAVGAEGETRSHVHTEGSVYVKGELWSATSPRPIEPNKKVKVVSRKGYTLVVEEITSAVPNKK